MCKEKENPRQGVVDFLEEQAIAYRYFKHAPAFTVEDCLQLPFVNADMTFCKNILLCNRQQTEHYLMLLRPETPFRTAVVSKALGVSRLSFAPPEVLPQLLRLTSGSLSPLGLYFDKERRIKLCYEKATQQTREIAFHPCDNSATLVFAQEVFWQQVLPALGVEPFGLEGVK